MASRSDTFGRLLKAGISSIANCEGRTAPAIEDELGALIGVAGYTIQRYKAGYVPPEPGAVRILAEACVRRGFLNRTWLASFLQAARYPHSHALIDELCPPGPAQPRAERVYANLPAPTYSQFIMRPDAYADVLDGLRQRSAVILIASLGGMGKTSLAREVAAACLLPGANPHFDAAVWVSDKDRPGATNLSLVLDEIARTLDYPGLAQFAFDEKRREAEQLLRRMRVLVVLDNFETVTDAALADWLLRLPEPSKAIITTREYRRAFRSSWPIDLGGMTDAEARALIAERLRVLKLERDLDIGQMLREQAELLGTPPVLVLDYIQHAARRLCPDDMRLAASRLSDDIARYVTDTQGTAFVISSVARHMYHGNENRSATEFLGAAKESGDLEFDAGGVFFLDTDVCPMNGTAACRLHIAKSRFGGEGQTLGLRFNGKVGSFVPDASAVMNEEQREAFELIGAGLTNVEDLAKQMKKQKAKVIGIVDALAGRQLIRRRPLEVIR